MITQRAIPVVTLLIVASVGCNIWPVDRRALSNNRHIRSAALKSIRNMEEMDRARLVDPLVKALSAPDDRITNRAAEALVAVGEPALDPLIAALGTPDPFMRTLAATVLGEIGSPAEKIGPELVEALNDGHPLVREEAAHALGRMGPSAMGAVPALYMTLQDSDPDVREAAQMALKKLGVEKAEAPKTPSKSS